MSVCRYADAAAAAVAVQRCGLTFVFSFCFVLHVVQLASILYLPVNARAMVQRARVIAATGVTATTDEEREELHIMFSCYDPPGPYPDFLATAPLTDTYHSPPSPGFCSLSLFGCAAAAVNSIRVPHAHSTPAVNEYDAFVCVNDPPDSVDEQPFPRFEERRFDQIDPYRLCHSRRVIQQQLLYERFVNYLATDKQRALALSHNAAVLSNHGMTAICERFLSHSDSWQSKHLYCDEEIDPWYCYSRFTDEARKNHRIFTGTHRMKQLNTELASDSSVRLHLFRAGKPRGLSRPPR